MSDKRVSDMSDDEIRAMAAPDPLALALYEIRARGYRRGETGDMSSRLSECAAIDISRLLAAVEAVLDLHRPGKIVVFGAVCDRHEAHRHFSITALEAADVVACPDCTASVYDSCAGCGPHTRLDQCHVRAAITAALLGEEDTDGT